jgi:hypothetical protein
MEQPSRPPKRAAVTTDGIKRLRADIAATLQATTGESQSEIAHLSDEEQLIALVKAAPDGLTGMQLEALLPGVPKRRRGAFRAASEAQRIIATVELRPNRAGRRQRQTVYRLRPCRERVGVCA